MLAAESGEDGGADEVRRAQSGDTAAFESLYRQNIGRIFALCRRLCGGDEKLAEEVTQDAFVRAWEKLDSFRGDAAFSTWLHRVAVNVALGDRRIRVRRAAVETPLTEEREAITGTAPSPVGARMDLESAIARLPERARTVFVLHEVEGYRHDEIADMADMAVGTSKAQLHRARKLLKEWL